MHTISQSIIEALGATLLHSLWQGLVIVLILSFSLKVLKHKSPQFKYHLSCASLLGLVIWMSSTFFNNFNYKIHHHSDVASSNNLVPNLLNGEINFEINEALHWQDNLEMYFSSFIELYASELVFIWFIGVILFGLKWTGAFYYTFTLKNRNTSIVPIKWQQKVKQLSYHLGIHKKINILESAKVDVPMVIGYLKPVILIPTSAFTGFTVEQLEAVIVHELAHIKNNDFLINMILSALEVVLFYHPAYWFIYKIIMQERENHCDDIAVAHIGNPRLYAETLFNMEKIRQQHSLAMALQGNKNQLLDRIKRICVAPNQAYKGGINKSGMAMGFLFILAIISLAKVPLDAKETILIPLSEEITESFNEAFIADSNPDLIIEEKVIPSTIEDKISSLEPKEIYEEINHAELTTTNSSSNLSLIPFNKEFNLTLENESILLQPLATNFSTHLMDTIPSNKDIVLTIVSELDKNGNTKLTYYKKGKVTKYIHIEKNKANYRLNGRKLAKGNNTYELKKDDSFEIKGTMQIFEVDKKKESSLLGDVDYSPETEGVVLTIISELDQDGNTKLTYYKKGKVTKRIYIEKDKAHFRLNKKKLPKGNKTYELKKGDLFTIKGKMQIFELEDKNQTSTLLDVNKKKVNYTEVDGKVVTSTSNLGKADKKIEGYTYYYDKDVIERTFVLEENDDELTISVYGKDGKLLTENVHKNSPDALLRYEEEIEREHENVKGLHRQLEMEHEKSMEKHEEEMKELDKEMEQHEKERKKHEKELKEHLKEMKEHEKELKEHQKELAKQHAEHDNMDIFKDVVLIELQNDKLIKNVKRFSFHLTKGKLKINGKRVHNKYHDKYLKLFEKYSGNKMNKNSNYEWKVF